MNKECPANASVPEPMAKKPVRPAYLYSATVLDVVDGDGIDLRVDLGFRMWAEVPMRLAGLNAPEKNTETGKAAKAFTEQWCKLHPTVMVATAKNPEKYGRWLAFVTVGNESLNDALVAAGHAFPWDGTGPRPIQ